MQADKQKAVVLPTPLLLQAVSKVEQVVARLQELQSSIAGSQLVTSSRFNSPSCRMPDLLGYSPKLSTAIECRGSFSKLGRLKGSTSTPERRKSLTLADGWRHWSTPANDIHDVLSEILLANQLNKRFVNLVGGSSNHSRQYDGVHKSKAKLNPSNKLLLGAKSDPENSSKRELHSSTRASVNSSLCSSDDSQSAVPELTVCSSVESLESTPRPSSRPIGLVRRSGSKRGSLKKPPPHLFKVVVGNEGPAAKAGLAISLRQVEARKTEARKLTTPSPLYKRRAGTLVQKPLRISSELRSSSTSQNSVIRCSVERKRLHDSASLRRSTEKFVEACRAMMEEEEQLRRANGENTGKAVHFSKSPPIVIRPLLFESPSMVKVKPAGKTHKNWLTNRFSKTSTRYSEKEPAVISKPKKKASSSKNLPKLISRLPCQKPELGAVPGSSTPAKDTMLVSRASSASRESLPAPSSLPLPLPPARQADNILKNSAARGMAMKASRDVKSGYTSYALEPSVVLNSSRESLASIDSNSLKEKENNRCSVGCPSKDLGASSKGRNNQSMGTQAEATLPSYMRPRAGAGGGKENNSKSVNTLRQSSAGTEKRFTTVKQSSGSLLHRAKDWVNLHKIKDKGTKRVPESSQRAALAS